MDCVVENGTAEDLDDIPTDSLSQSNVSLAKNEEKSKMSVLPKYRYNRDELLALKEARHSRMKPAKLSEEFELEDGRWDPDKWFYSIDRSSDVPLLKPERPSARLTRPYVVEEKVHDIKRSGGDFKRTISGIDDDTEISLVPQRNSFNTGCNALRNGKRDQSPRREGRERSHRIGSGRVQIGDRRPEKLDMESNERRAGGGRYDYDRKEERFRRGERKDMNSRAWQSQRDRSSDGSHRSDHRLASGSRSQTETGSRSHGKEPEWFTRGPTSKADIIELCGFGVRSLDGDVDLVEEDPAKVNLAGCGDSIRKKKKVPTATLR